MNEKRNSFASNLLGIIFLIWFIGSLGAIIYLSKKENSTEWMLILFGQYFLVFGIIAICNNLSKKLFPFILLIFPLAGVGLIGSGVYMLTGNEKQIDQLVSVIAPFLLASAFPIVGILFIAMSLQSYYRTRKYCTLELDALCKEIITQPGVEEADTYMPIYEVSYRGKTYTIKNNNFTNLAHWVVGDYYTIKVNPNNIYEFVDDNEKAVNKFQVIFGIIAILVGVAIFIVIMK